MKHMWMFGTSGTWHHHRQRQGGTPSSVTDRCCTESVYMFAYRSRWPSSNLFLLLRDRQEKQVKWQKGQQCYCKGWWFGCERGTVSGGFLNQFSPLLLLHCPPMAFKGEWQVSLPSFPPLPSCLTALWQGRGLTARLFLLNSLLW